MDITTGVAKYKWRQAILTAGIEEGATRVDSASIIVGGWSDMGTESSRCARDHALDT